MPDPPEARRLGDGFGYRAVDTGRVPGQEPALPGKYVVLAFSGGGTRAAALAHGTLRELEATRSPATPDLTLLEAVDMVSSTSGGSVAAANFVLHGRGGYGSFHEDDGFLLHDGMTELVGGVLNPLHVVTRMTSSTSRTQLLSGMFRRKVFKDATFRTLQDQRARHPPLLVLNSADMATGERFPFVQRQLDRLCLDLRDIFLADAVAASAAFPVALTPLRLPDRSPCPAQQDGQGARLVDGALREAGASRSELAAACRDGRPVLDVRDQSFLPRGRRQMPLLNLDACGRPLPADDPNRVRFVHLLDGGIADNLGLAGPLETLTGIGDDGRVVGAMQAGVVREVVVIAVNSRSQGSTRIGRDAATPGIVSMAGAVISTTIDGRSGGLLAQLQTLPKLVRETFRERGDAAPAVTTLSVDFELIRDPVCRARFQEIGTNWSLSRDEIDALQEMASAMLRASPAYLRVAKAPDPERQAEAAQARAAQACARLQGTLPKPAPLVFGPA